jgi:hypothetical protein
MNLDEVSMILSNYDLLIDKKNESEELIRWRYLPFLEQGLR